MIFNVILLTLILAGLLLAGGILHKIRRANRTARVRAWGYPLEWIAPLDRVLPPYTRLPYDLRESTQKLIFDKMNDLYFDGMGEFEDLTIEHQLNITSHGCLLHANLKIPPNPELRYVACGKQSVMEEILETQPDRWPAAWLVAVWDEADQQFRHFREEQEPVIRETWQSLLPAGPEKPANLNLYYAAWGRSYWTEQERIRERMRPQAPDLLDGEGAAERFAAASEAFIRFPKSLHTKKPNWYNALKLFYQFDPLRWK